MGKLNYFGLLAMVLILAMVVIGCEKADEVEEVQPDEVEKEQPDNIDLEKIASIFSHDGPVWTVHQQGDILATASMDDEVHQYDISDPRVPELLARIKSHKDGNYDGVPSVHQQGDILATGSTVPQVFRATWKLGIVKFIYTT